MGELWENISGTFLDISCGLVCYIAIDDGH